jgi:hypothetical protein
MQRSHALARSLAIEIKYTIRLRPLSEEDRERIERAAEIIIEILSESKEQSSPAT